MNVNMSIRLTAIVFRDGDEKADVEGPWTKSTLTGSKGLSNFTIEGPRVVGLARWLLSR
jgi:hypothetical protein